MTHYRKGALSYQSVAGILILDVNEAKAGARALTRSPISIEEHPYEGSNCLCF